MPKNAPHAVDRKSPSPLVFLLKVPLPLAMGAFPHLAIRNDTDYITSKHGLKTVYAQRISHPPLNYIDKL